MFSRHSIFAPILVECHFILDRLLSSGQMVPLKVRRYVVDAIISTKLCYNSMIARMTDKQYRGLRSRIFQVIFPKPLASYLAAVALIFKGHALDYRFSALYTSLCSWERYFKAHGPSEFLQYYTASNGTPGLGPISLFRSDLSLLGWRLDIDTCSVYDGTGCLVWPFGQAGVAAFKHSLRSAYRHALLGQLEASSLVWGGAGHIDIVATTALHRKWKDHPSLCILERFLSHAHCTPDRLYRMDKRLSPECPYCGFEQADTAHFLFSCSYFARFREDAPAFIRDSEDWPPCSRHCLLCPASLPVQTRAAWGFFQEWACGLFALWLQLERENNAPERQGDDPVAPGPCGALGTAPAHGLLPLHVVQGHPVDRLPLSWQPFRNRSEWAAWRSSPQFFAQLFLFWSSWTAKEVAGARPVSWSEALLLYLTLAGRDAHRFGDVTFPQAVYLFRTLSVKLLARSGLQFPAGSESVRWNRDLPPDASFIGIFPSVHISAELLEVLLLLQGEATSRPSVSKAYIHVQYFDLLPDSPSRLSCDSDFFRFLRVKLKCKTRAPPWWSCAKLISRLLVPQSVEAIEVRPGQGLTQLSIQQWASLGPAQALVALGPAYMSSLAVLRRQWDLALASLQDDSFGTHSVCPVWHTEDWTCLGCNRSANFTRDPKWATKPCPSPVSFAGSWTPLWEVRTFLECLDASIRFLHFPHPLSDKGLPVLADVLETLRASATSLSRSSFASLLAFSLNFPRLAVKYKDCLLRWNLLLHNWQHKGHAFVPATLLATDGYCVSCRVRPKDFQSFPRRPCKAPVLSSELSPARAALLEFHQALSSLSLQGGWAPVFTGFVLVFLPFLCLLFGSEPFLFRALPFVCLSVRSLHSVLSWMHSLLCCLHALLCNVSVHMYSTVPVEESLLAVRR